MHNDTGIDGSGWTRLQRSASTRHWYAWRRRYRLDGTPLPSWVICSPPWPVWSLAARLKGQSPIKSRIGFLISMIGSGIDELEGFALTTRDTGQRSDPSIDLGSGQAPGDHLTAVTATGTVNCSQ